MYSHSAEVNMRFAFLCTVLLLAGAVSSSAVNVDTNSIQAWAADAKLDIPDWILDLIGRLPESIQDFIDRLPEIIAAIPDILEQIINSIPELIPIIIEAIPDIIAQVPSAIDTVKEFLLSVIERLPELIPIIIEAIPEEVIAAIPEIYQRIREILAGLDWFPDIQKPDWWPEEFPSIPEYNRPVPGTRTSVEEHPGIVQIEIGSGLIWAQGCVGSVLTNFHILSTANCFTGALYADRFRQIRAGSSTRYEGGTKVAVDNVIRHPSFGASGRFDANIAVVRMATNLILGGTIQQTPIVAQDFNMPANFAVQIASWGATSQGGYIIDRNLYSIDLVTIDRQRCLESWSRIPVVEVTNDMICIGRPETGGRNGDIRDVGAPVMFQGAQVAMVALGVPLGNQAFEVLATNVGAYTNWIIANAN